MLKLAEAFSIKPPRNQLGVIKFSNFVHILKLGELDRKINVIEEKNGKN